MTLGSGMTALQQPERLVDVILQVQIFKLSQRRGSSQSIVLKSVERHRIVVINYKR